MTTYDDFTNEQLEDLICSELIYPKDRKKLQKDLDDYLIKLGAKQNDEGDFVDEEANLMVPMDYWYEACDVACSLASILLEERSDTFEDLNGNIEDIERAIDSLKKIIDKRKLKV